MATEGRWREDGDSLVADLEVPDLAAALAHVDRVAGAPEAASHHPDIPVRGRNEVRLALTARDTGGLMQADRDMAAASAASTAGSMSEVA